MKLLLVEDEQELAQALVYGFQKYGYAIDWAADGQEALSCYEINSYDLMILDLNLPVLDGIEVLREIRKEDKEMKIIILSARSELEDKIVGLDFGANDYVTKPFHFKELVARVRSLLLRTFTQNSPHITCGAIDMNLAAKSVTVNQEHISLSVKEFAILEYLILHKEKTVSSEELIEHIWDSNTDLFSNAVKVHISSIRRKLKLAGVKDIIHNIRGAGYRIEEES